jgi:hypothetical protein
MNNATIVPQLVKKDFQIWGRMILVFYAVSLLCMTFVALLHGRIPDRFLVSWGFSLLVTPAGTLGIVLLIQSNVFEKAKSTQPFIMSLPVTVREFTLAKLLVNVPTFTVLWLLTTGAAFGFAYGFHLLPLGTLPFMTMIFVGVFVAYLCILAVSLLSQSLGITILGIMFAELGTSAYLWALVLWRPISSHFWGSAPVWNTQAVAIVTVQCLLAVVVTIVTVTMQNRKRDFL